MAKIISGTLKEKKSAAELQDSTILPIAAIVFEFGVLVQSPNPNIFGYFVCRSVLGSTQRNPASLVNIGCSFKTATGPIGGVT